MRIGRFIVLPGGQYGCGKCMIQLVEMKRGESLVLIEINNLVDKLSKDPGSPSLLAIVS